MHLPCVDVNFLCNIIMWISRHKYEGLFANIFLAIALLHCNQIECIIVVVFSIENILEMKPTLSAISGIFSRK